MARGLLNFVLMLDTTKLRVCFLAGTLGRGGSEQQLLYMLRALKSQGVSTRVISLTSGETFEKEIRSLDIKVESVAYPRTSRPRKLYRIVRNLHREPADILQSIHFYTNSYSAVVGRLLKTHDIGAIRSNLQFAIQTNGPIGRLHLRLPRHLITNSALAQRQAIELGVSPDAIDLLPNVVEACYETCDRHHRANGTVRVLFAGRLIKEKRADRFLRVLSKVRQQAPHIRFKAALAGGGPLSVEIKSQAAALGLTPDILELLGETRNMTAAYKQADLLMLTSDWEGTPNVLLEAMSHGLPIAATRVGGVPEVVTSERGLLADPQDEDGLARAVLQLVSDAALRSRLGQSGRDYVARFHSLDALPDRLIAVYQKVLSV